MLVLHIVFKCMVLDIYTYFSTLSEPLSWLDQDTSDLSDSVLEFDLETFGLDSEGFPSLEDLAYAQ